MITPTPAEIISFAVAAKLADAWTVSAGIVKAVGAGTVDVQPVVRRPAEAADGSTTYEDLPIIPNCRIGFLQGAQVAITFGLSVGDTGILLHTTYSIDEWRSTGEVSSPLDTATHHLGNAIFLPMLVSDAKTATYATDPDLVLEPGAQFIRLGGLASQFVALENLVHTELTKLYTALSTATYSPGPGAATTLTIANPYTYSSVAASKVKAE